MPKVVSVVLIFLVFLVGCSQGEPTSTPSTIPPTNAPNAEVVNTPGSFSQGDTPTPPPAFAPTLPPTWTQTASPTLPFTATETPGTPTPTLDLTNMAMIQNPTAVVCTSFRVLFEESSVSFPRGTNPRVSWTPVLDALGYRVTLLNEKRDMLVLTIIAETTIDFAAETFEFEKSYFWEVRPINREGNQLCAAAGGALIPTG